MSHWLSIFKLIDDGFLFNDEPCQNCFMDYDKVILHGKFILDSLFYNMSKFTLNVEEKVVETTTSV